MPCEPYTKLDPITQTCSPCRLGYSCRRVLQLLHPLRYVVVILGAVLRHDADGLAGAVAGKREVEGTEEAVCAGNAAELSCRSRNKSPLRTLFAQLSIVTVVIWWAGRASGAHRVRRCSRRAAPALKFRLPARRAVVARFAHNALKAPITVLPGVAHCLQAVSWLTHPDNVITYNLTFLLFNDYDPDTDPLFFASAAISGAARGASMLPKGFSGPISVTYTVMETITTPTAMIFALCR
jgi:hypothetical protein